MGKKLQSDTQGQPQEKAPEAGGSYLRLPDGELELVERTKETENDASSDSTEGTQE